MQYSKHTCLCCTREVYRDLQGYTQTQLQLQFWFVVAALLLTPNIKEESVVTLWMKEK